MRKISKLSTQYSAGQIKMCGVATPKPTPHLFFATLRGLYILTVPPSQFKTRRNTIFDF